MTQEKDTLRVELAAIAANNRKASKLASRFAACYERLVQAKRSTATAGEALEEKRREAAALLDELAAIVNNAWKAGLRSAACYARLVSQDNTVPEGEALKEARVEAGLSGLRLGATILSALWGPEARQRLKAITARTAGASRQATIKALAEFIIDEGGRMPAEGRADRDLPTDPV